MPSQALLSQNRVNIEHCGATRAQGAPRRHQAPLPRQRRGRATGTQRVRRERGGLVESPDGGVAYGRERLTIGGEQRKGAGPPKAGTKQQGGGGALREAAIRLAERWAGRACAAAQGTSLPGSGSFRLLPGLGRPRWDPRDRLGPPDPPGPPGTAPGASPPRRGARCGPGSPPRRGMRRRRRPRYVVHHAEHPEQVLAVRAPHPHHRRHPLLPAGQRGGSDRQGEPGPGLGGRPSARRGAEGL